VNDRGVAKRIAVRLGKHIRERRCIRRLLTDDLRGRLPHGDRSALLVGVLTLGGSVDDRHPPLRRRRSPPTAELERSGRVDQLLCAVEHLVRLVRLALESDADLGIRLVRVAGGANANGDNITALEIDLHADQGGVLNFGFHG